MVTSPTIGSNVEEVPPRADAQAPSCALPSAPALPWQPAASWTAHSLACAWRGHAVAALQGWWVGCHAGRGPALPTCELSPCSRHDDFPQRPNKSTGLFARAFYAAAMPQIVFKNLHFTMWDIGGQDSLRTSWSTYYTGAKVRSGGLPACVVWCATGIPLAAASPPTAVPAPAAMLRERALLLPALRRVVVVRTVDPFSDGRVTGGRAACGVANGCGLERLRLWQCFSTGSSIRHRFDRRRTALDCQSRIVSFRPAVYTWPATYPPLLPSPSLRVHLSLSLSLSLARARGNGMALLPCACVLRASCVGLGIGSVLFCCAGLLFYPAAASWILTRRSS